MDLSTLAISQNEFKMAIRHPATREVILDDDGKEMFIGVLSSDTQVAKKELTAFKRAVREAGKDVTEEKLHELKCKFLSKITTSCNMVFDKKAVKFSCDNIYNIIVKPDFSWLADDLMRTTDARGNFMQS